MNKDSHRMSKNIVQHESTPKSGKIYCCFCPENLSNSLDEKSATGVDTQNNMKF